MSWIKCVMCDSCGGSISEREEERFRTGYCHTCEKCQMEQWGFIVSDEIDIELVLAQEKNQNKEGG